MALANLLPQTGFCFLPTQINRLIPVLRELDVPFYVHRVTGVTYQNNPSTYRTFASGTLFGSAAWQVHYDVTVPQYNIDVQQLEAAISDKSKAVIIAHTLGNPFDLKAVKEFCNKHNLWLIEDNCDALGSKYTIDEETRFTGTWGDIGTSSFYPPHHMTMGEGGAVYTNDPLLNRLILSYRDWGSDCICHSGHDNFCGHRFDGDWSELPHGYNHKYVYSHFGYNLKVTDMQAAVGVEQLKKFPEFIKIRQQNWKYLRDQLDDLKDVLILPEPAENSEPSWFGFLISVRPESSLSRNKVTRYIEEHNVQTRLLFSGNII